MRRIAILLGVAAAAATPAYACSPVPGYRVPGNYGLVRDADLVVLGRVKSGPSAEALAARKDSDWPSLVEIEPLRAIKGPLPSDTLRVRGYVSVEGKAFKPHPTPLHRPHPSSLHGACVRLEYAVGALVVAVLRRTDGGLKQEGSPFARTVEDVEGPQGTWVRAADTYAAIASLPVSEREKAMRREIERLLALQNDSAAPAIAADLVDALGFAD